MSADDDERNANFYSRGGQSSSYGGGGGSSGHHQSGSHHEKCGNRALDDAFEDAHSTYKQQAKELKQRKSAIRRKAEAFDEDEEASVRQRAGILVDLRDDAERNEEALVAAKRRGHTVATEVAELRGRLAHVSKEQAQWEQDLRGQEAKEMEGLMVELQRLRRANPEAASRLAAERRTEKDKGGGGMLALTE